VEGLVFGVFAGQGAGADDGYGQENKARDFEPKSVKNATEVGGGRAAAIHDGAEEPISSGLLGGNARNNTQFAGGGKARHHI